MTLEQMTEQGLVKDGVTTRKITFVYKDIGASATIPKGTDLKELNAKLRDFKS